MAQAKSISLSHFTTAVQSAVKAAVKKHPKFKVEIPQEVSFGYVIRGFPVPPDILNTVTIGEAQAFANDVASHVAAQPAVADAIGLGQGAIYCGPGHIICGMPADIQFALKE